MASIRRVKTSFAAGELAAELVGRSDLRAYENGAARLRNVFILPTGGVQRRPGLRHIANVAGPARLLGFEFNTEQTYLMVLRDRAIDVFRADVRVTTITTPWTAAQLNQLSFTQSADTLLVTHPEVQPRRITRTGAASWSISPWAFAAEPYFRFAPPEVTLTPSATAGAITLVASAPVFMTAHETVVFRIATKRLRIDTVTSGTSATATVLDTLPAITPTIDWEEAAFSPARGWPVALCFHQDRLVIGGSRDLPNRLWLSRTGDLFNFDLGEGLDDQAIEFALVSDQVNAIRAVFSGRHLQVFTSGTEWMVTGDPLTPANIQLNRQTRIGSPTDRIVPPVDVDGSTIFVARTGRAVHEFAYTDVEQAYQSADLAILARHLVDAPLAMAYDQARRLLHLVMADGSLGTLTIFRAEQVTAWTRQETDGTFRSVAEIEGGVYLLVERDGTWRLERLDDRLGVDAGVVATSVTAQASWPGFAHLNGRSVAVVADGSPRGTTLATLSRVAVDPPAFAIQAGLPFTHVIQPLPPELAAQYGARNGPLRLLSASFRVLETQALRVDLGRGLEPVSFRRLGPAVLDQVPAPYSGDRTLRALGWSRDTTRPLWRIEGSDPLPLTLLTVTTETRVNE